MGYLHCPESNLFGFFGKKNLKKNGEDPRNQRYLQSTKDALKKVNLALK